MKKEYNSPNLEIYELDEAIMATTSESVGEDIFGDEEEGGFGE